MTGLQLMQLGRSGELGMDRKKVTDHSTPDARQEADAAHAKVLQVECKQRLRRW